MERPETDIERILDSIHEGLLAVDAAGRVTLFNRAARRLMGLSAARVLGRPVAEVIPNTRLHLVLKSGRAELDRTQQVGNITILTNRVPLKDAAGRITGAVAVFRDISEIERLAGETVSLRETRTLLHAIINSTQDAISVVDEHGLGLLINPAYTRLTGLTEEDVLNRPPTVDIAEGESVHLQVLRTGRAVRNVPMKVGPKRKEVLVDAAPIVVNGLLKGSVGVIHDVSEIRRLSDELERARRLIRRLEARYTFEDIAGESNELLAAVEQARKAAETPATVILRGESGTGKELFAHAIHQASPRCGGQFVRVNCAAIPETLLESELFGYVEGSFTGARRGGRKGYFAEADGGTIFLDEVGEINPGVQVKLLRVLQEHEIVRVGDSRPLNVDVRVIAATNANLEQMVRRGHFREDLYYRLNVLPVHIPPLRRRRGDVPLLVNFLLRKLNQEYGRNVAGISPEALQLLMNYDWPGNVRELENVLGRALINMKRGETQVQAVHLPPLGMSVGEGAAMPEDEAPPGGYQGETLAVLRERWERRVLQEALQKNGGNRTRTARMLGISLRSLYNKMERYGLV
ncbi:sigma-54 interaction domain-containing protein [Desulfotomaculum copahuensis]|uniref:Sigma-54-dependent Fis family transcriptional regulator n=1 Tax=Desulfotomaculum copahuensis TaxID=1838280 RepID=A0A1B7LD99_9FIRM|nr:sigma-54-dependent Fis family transcriptional regulator [Desulfotomaculum copahuensis]OAT81070.1 sigma-54-dependent Fis family transcriptional regulator [Desulfotomaculum copahuensis]